MHGFCHDGNDTMSNYQLMQVLVAKTGMFIRRPVADVFAAFIEPIE
jgi:hypothetical protein